MAASGGRFFNASRFPEATAEAVFGDPLTWASIQIEKLHCALVPSGPLGKLYVEIAEDPSINACVVSRPSFSVISFNAGLCVRLRQLFLCVVSDESIFERREFERELDFVAFVPDGAYRDDLVRPADIRVRRGTEGDSDYADWLGPIPPTKERYFLAERLATAAIDFLAMHEFSHVVRNHGVLLGEQCRHCFFEAPRVVQMAASSGLGRDDERTNQLLEVDADQWASHLSMLKFTSGEHSVSYWGKWATTRPDSLKLWLFAVTMMWMLLDGWDENLDRGGTHPHPAPRLLAMLLGLDAQINADHDGVCGMDLYDACVQTARLSRRAWCNLGLSVDRLYSFLDMNQVSAIANRLIDGRDEQFGVALEKQHLWRVRRPG
ncbi:MAG TPA: hypothetical protein VD971_04780 [Phycisphaerales bacterium]|nr:hypothetical protein [Phycisphaerales bacterium]